MNVGTAIGYRAPYGLWGVFFSYQPSGLQNNIELNIGAGINHSYIVGSGWKFRLLRSESGLMESMLSFNYSFNFIFFFKQKTAYEIGLGIPAEPLFRSGFMVWSNFT